MIYIYSKDLDLSNRYAKMSKEFKYEFFENIDSINIKHDDILIFFSTKLELIKDYNFLNELLNLNVSIIVLDTNPSFEKGMKLLSLGIKGYANMMVNDIHLKDVIDTVKNGNIWLYPEFINYLALNLNTIKKDKDLNKEFEILTEKEKEVAFLVLNKYSYSDISKKLNISLRTVKAHTKHIYEKFDVTNRLTFILKFS